MTGVDTVRRGVNTVSLIIAAVFVLLFARLGYLQVLGMQSLGSGSGSIRRILVLPPRGHLIDRNGKIILENRPLYSVKVIPSEFQPSRAGFLAYLLQMPEGELNTKISEGRAFSPFAAATVYRDLNALSMARVSENLWQLPGVLIDVETKRKYTGTFYGSHLIGYLRSISKDRLDAMTEKGYSPDDKIGFTGLEKYYEDQLKGEKGARFELVNPLGEFAGRYEEGRSDIPSVKGDDLYLTIDSGLQELAETLLRQTGRSGAVVAIDPETGGILALTSQPDFDLEILNGTTGKEEWADIALSPEKPLFNRSIQAAYPPGSTYKLLLAIAALEEHDITQDRAIYCTGVFNLGTGRFRCHGGQAHGSVNMKKAIIESCNVYFNNLIFRVGFDRWTEYGRMFGFGRKSGIDLPGEKAGTLPSADYYNRRYGEGKWTRGYLVSLAIGQGELSTTPLQLANFAATIANDGTWNQPHFVRGYRDSRSGKYVPISHEQRKLPVAKRTFDIVKEAMQGVVLQGTGTLAQVPGVTVAGKTGTAQNPHGKDHAWFIAFAPVDHPRIAITVLVENAGFGGSVSAPIARELINYYVNGTQKSSAGYSPSKAAASVKAISDSLNANRKETGEEVWQEPARPDSSGTKRPEPKKREPYEVHDDI